MREAEWHTRPEPFGRGDQRVDRKEGRQELEGRRGRRQRRPCGRPGVEADHGLGLLARGEQRIPVLGEDRRQSELGGELGEAHRLEAALGVAVDLVGPDADIGEPRQLQRDDPLGMSARPDLEMPVVPGAETGQAEFGILGAVEHRPAESRDERGEAERRPHPVQVHIRHTGVDVVAARPHLLEAGRIHAPFLARSADDRVEADVRVPAVLVEPELRTVGILHHPGRTAGEARRDPPVEEVGRFDQMVVHRDDRDPDRTRLRVGKEARGSGGPGPVHHIGHRRGRLASARGATEPGGR